MKYWINLILFRLILFLPYPSSPLSLLDSLTFSHWLNKTAGVTLRRFFPFFYPLSPCPDFNETWPWFWGSGSPVVGTIVLLPFPNYVWLLILKSGLAISAKLTYVVSSKSNSNVTKKHLKMRKKISNQNFFSPVKGQSRRSDYPNRPILERKQTKDWQCRGVSSEYFWRLKCQPWNLKRSTPQRKAIQFQKSSVNIYKYVSTTVMSREKREAVFTYKIRRKI